MNISMPIDDYTNMLTYTYMTRENDIPQPVFDYVISLASNGEYLGTPIYVIDNLDVNGDYGPASSYYPNGFEITRDFLEDEKDKDNIELVYDDPNYPDEPCVLISLGL